MKVDILAFGAHPDDVELGCGGTISKAIQAGKTAAIIDLTRGELGTRGTATIRAIEAANAAEILGIKIRENLNLPDGFIFNNKENQLKVIEKIRQYQPEIVLCNAIADRHIDHGRSNTLVREACFLSGLQKIITKGSEGKNQNSWRPKAIYSYIQWNSIPPDFVVDITCYIDLKIKAVAAYKSQFYNSDSKEPETPISSQNFMDSVRYRAADLGRLSNTDFAEGFTSERLISVNDIFDLK
ncbi:MAG: bacillithiol biosynthesis deacetylase BshB1 [Flavobacteriaceae bacterium]